MARGIAEVQTPGRRMRSEGKRKAITDAAEELFVTRGYEGVTVDAIAAQARVSKRTVYDHFGDKGSIFLRVLQNVNSALVEDVRVAIDEELVDGRDLRTALVAFTERLVTETFRSSQYTTFRRLSALPGAIPRLGQTERDQPEKLLELRFAALIDSGALVATDPVVVVRHFTALTVGLAFEALEYEREGRPAPLDPATIITEGVGAFLRAYQSPTSASDH